MLCLETFPLLFVLKIRSPISCDIRNNSQLKALNKKECKCKAATWRISTTHTISLCLILLTNKNLNGGGKRRAWALHYAQSDRSLRAALVGSLPLKPWFC